MFYSKGVLWFELFLLISSECLLLDYGGISPIFLPIDRSGKNILKEISSIFVRIFSYLILNALILR